MNKHIYFLTAILLLIFLPINSCRTPDLPVERHTQIFEDSHPKHLIILMVNGSSINHWSALRAHTGKSLNIDKILYTGWVNTQSVKSDPKAEFTAISRMLHSSGNQRLIPLFIKNNFHTGIITASDLTNPVINSLVSNELGNELVAKELVNLNINYIIGGGKQFFTNRSDNENLIHSLMSKEYSVIEEYKGVSRIRGRSTAALLEERSLPPLFNNRPANYFNEATKSVMYRLGAVPQGSFLFIETSHIDAASLSNNSDYLLSEMEELDKVIGTIMQYVNSSRNTLFLVLTAWESGGVQSENLKDKSRISWSRLNRHNAYLPVFAAGPGAKNFSGVHEAEDIYKLITKLLMNREAR